MKKLICCFAIISLFFLFFSCNKISDPVTSNEKNTDSSPIVSFTLTMYITQTNSQGQYELVNYVYTTSNWGYIPQQSFTTVNFNPSQYYIRIRFQWSGISGQDYRARFIINNLFDDYIGTSSGMTGDIAKEYYPSLLSGSTYYWTMGPVIITGGDYKNN
jgi:hypothetical protein